MAAHKARTGLGFCILLLLPLCFAHQQLATAPAFVWGSGDRLQQATGQGTQISYQTLPVSKLVDEVLKSLSEENATTRPEVLVVMLGTQLSMEELPAASRGMLAPLQAMLSKAVSSVTLPFVQHSEEEGGTYAQLATQLAAAAPAGALSLTELCADNMDVQAAVSEALGGVQDGSLRVLLLCNPKEGDLETEMGVLQGAVQAVQAAGKQYIALYTANRVQQAGARRTLLQHQADGQGEEGAEAQFDDQSEECDADCQMQVRVLEAFILLILLLIAVAFGTWMMSAVDTPTRFEAPKREHQAME